MAFCGSCGSANPDDISFCSKCGATLVERRPIPKTEIVASAVFYRSKIEAQLKATVPETATKILVWTILLACIIVFVFALMLLSGTRLGFALVFGSGILAYECFLVLKKLAS
jgi:uncharacterized membrane protein YvbJ